MRDTKDSEALKLRYMSHGEYSSVYHNNAPFGRYSFYVKLVFCQNSMVNVRVVENTTESGIYIHEYPIPLIYFHLLVRYSFSYLF